MDRRREGKKRGRVNQREEGCRLFPSKDLQQEDVYFEIYSLDFSSIRKMYVLKFPLMEIQSKILKSLNGLTIQDLD